MYKSVFDIMYNKTKVLEKDFSGQEQKAKYVKYLAEGIGISVLLCYTPYVMENRMKECTHMKISLTGAGFFGKLIAFVLVVAIIVGVCAVFGPRLLHNCDNCGDFFVGTGYYTNIISSTLANLTGGEDKVICGDCATKDHALAIAAGQSIEEFKRPLFETEED